MLRLSHVVVAEGVRLVPRVARMGSVRAKRPHHRTTNVFLPRLWIQAEVAIMILVGVRLVQQDRHTMRPLTEGSADLAEWRNGRRWGLKIPCPLGRVGSNPTSAIDIGTE